MRTLAFFALLIAMLCAGCVYEKDPGVRRDGVYRYIGWLNLKIREGNIVRSVSTKIILKDTVTREWEYGLTA